MMKSQKTQIGDVPLPSEAQRNTTYLCEEVEEFLNEIDREEWADILWEKIDENKESEDYVTITGEDVINAGLARGKSPEFLQLLRKYGDEIPVTDECTCNYCNDSHTKPLDIDEYLSYQGIRLSTEEQRIEKSREMEKKKVERDAEIARLKIVIYPIITKLETVASKGRVPEPEIKQLLGELPVEYATMIYTGKWKGNTVPIQHCIMQLQSKLRRN